MNAAAHALHAATVVGGAHAMHDFRQHGQLTPLPLASGGLAALLGSLPDWIEPTCNTHHRQFFTVSSSLPAWATSPTGSIAGNPKRPGSSF